MPPHDDAPAPPDSRALVARTEQLHEQITEPRDILWMGVSLRVDPGVFNPAFSNVGDLLATHMGALPGELVLDLGTGTGFQALVAARTATTVVAVDRQPEAARCAAANVRAHGLEGRVDVRCGDLFEALRPGEAFDRILFNFPFIPWQPETDWQRANSDFDNRTLRRFLSDARDWMRPGGRIVMTWADIGGLARYQELVAHHGYDSRCLAARGAAGLKHYVFQLKPREDWPQP